MVTVKVEVRPVQFRYQSIGTARRAKDGMNRYPKVLSDCFREPGFGINSKTTALSYHYAGKDDRLDRKCFT